MGKKLNHELLRRNHCLHYVMTNTMTITLFQNRSYHSKIILKTLCIKNFVKVNNFCMRSFFMTMENCIRNSDKLFETACVILKNLASVSGQGRRFGQKIFQCISWIDICSSKIWNGNVITTVESSWCIIYIVSNFC